MLGKERLFRIISIIEERRFVTITELMHILEASKSTVSRDLLELEKQGLIHRERGGAMCKEMPETLSSVNDLPVHDKEGLHAQKKYRICRKASTIVNDGDCIYIDSGTTPADLITFISDKQIKLVTASMYIVKRLPKNFRGELFLIGGHYIPSYDMSVGHMTIEDIHKFHFDHAFFTASGIELATKEVMAIDFDISAVKSAVLNRCMHAYLLADSSKLTQKALCTWATTTQFEYIFMDAIQQEDLPDNIILCE